MFRLKQKEIDGIIILTVGGNLMGGGESGKFHALVKKLLSAGNNKIVVNLSGARWVNSLGLGMLIGAYTSLKNAGGTLVLTHVCDKINSILMVTKLLLIFKTFETDEQAVAYLLVYKPGEDEGTEKDTASA